MIDKHEMLALFIEMLNKWELLKQSEGQPIYELRRCNGGLCNYLHKVKPSLQDSYIIYLSQDLLEPVNHVFNSYWYPCYFDNCFYYSLIDFQIVIENQIQPRIDHLKRTIARLENELAASN
jgi:hypothetical protein